jgi:peptide chain release factor subunit 1
MESSIQTASTGASDNKHIAIWKIKKLIVKLDNCKGNGTSMVTLVIPPGEDIVKTTKLLSQE